MTCIHENKVNKLAEFNLIHDILNPSKRTKNMNRHDYPILQGYMNIRKGKEKFKTFSILLDSGCIFTIIIRRANKNLLLKKAL